MGKKGRPDPIITKRLHTMQEAKVKASFYCAYQERTHEDVRKKLYSLGLREEEVEEILSDLIVEDFVNEERFAKTFAGGKFRLKKWGKKKIKHELKKRKISPYCVEKAMEEIDDDIYRTTMTELIAKKWEKTSGRIPSRKSAVVRYLMGKGYEPGLVWELINKKY